jgi:hypothetical protein
VADALRLAQTLLALLQCHLRFDPLGGVVDDHQHARRGALHEGDGHVNRPAFARLGDDGDAVAVLERLAVQASLMVS